MSKRGFVVLVLGLLGLTIWGCQNILGDVLAVRKIVVEGGERLTDDDVQGMINIRVGDSFIGVDLQAAERRLQQHPWVRSASVTFQYPRLRVVVQERRPFAVIQTLDQGLTWCDEEGFVLEPYAGQQQEPPVIPVEGLGPIEADERGPRIGNDAQWRAIRRLLGADFSNAFEVEKLRFFPEWVELFVDDNRRIRLPLAGLEKALNRLQWIWTMLKKRVSLHSLDLRFAGEIVYEGTPH